MGLLDYFHRNATAPPPAVAVLAPDAAAPAPQAPPPPPHAPAAPPAVPPHPAPAPAPPQAAQAAPSTAPAPPAERQNDIPTLRPEIALQPHQIRAVNRMLENDGKIILVHGPGSGKTFTAVAGVERLRQLGRATKALVVTPSGLRTNFLEGGVQKATTRTGVIADNLQEIDPAADYNIVSYEAFRKDPVGMMQRSGADTLVLDEMHRIRNEDSATYHAIAAGRALAHSFIGLTGSFVNNSPDEIGPLLAISENNPSLTRGGFDSKFVQRIGSVEGITGSRKPLVGVRDPAAFAKAVYPKIDYVNTEDIAGDKMPRKNVTNVYVPMSGEQYRLYQHAMDKLGPIADYIMSRNKNVRVGATDRIFTQLMEARQVSNSVGRGLTNMTPARSAERTPKVQKLIGDTIQHLADRPDNAVVLYSNLIHGGVDVLHAGLKAAGIPHALFIGKGTEVDQNHVTEVTRQAGVHDFKAGKIRAIIISGAGSEGLDLKNASAFYALDGHFNPERILQAEARARRLGGLADRPPAERVVDVRRYQSVAPGAAGFDKLTAFLGMKPPMSVDQWIYSTAARKYKTNEQFYGVLRHPSKFLRKEVITGRDGTVRIKYVYPSEVRQPGMLAQWAGAPSVKVEDP